MRKTGILILCMLMSIFAYSQWTYNTAYYMDGGNPGGLNTESDATLGSWTTIMAGSQAANVWTAPETLPFPFDFYGSPVTSFIASQNGVVTFDTGTGILPGANENLPTVNIPDNSICGFWDEFTSSPSTGANDEIRVNTFGTAPNRQYWIRWYSFEMGNPFVSYNYFAIVLEETTNKIYVVDQYSNANVDLTATVGVQQNATTAVQNGGDMEADQGNGSLNPDNDYYEFVPIQLVADDIGVSSIDNPSVPTTAGTQNVDVTLTNFGLNTVSSATINWTIDGAPQAPFSYSGSLGAGLSTPITLGSYNFPMGFTTITAWTTMPNGSMDNAMSNDTSSVSLCTGLGGNYTVGGAGADFPDLTAAVASLDCGIVSPVTFNVAAGTYTEALHIEEVIGASATNTVTFDGGSPGTTTITHEAVSGGQFSVILLDGADFITFKNFTIENTATTDAWGFRLTDMANNCTIEDNIINMDPGATSDVCGVLASDSPTNDFAEGDNCNDLMVLNNVITGGEYSIHLEGLGSAGADFETGNTIIGNTLTGAEDYGIYLDNQQSVTISNNVVSGLRNNFADGIYLFDIVDYTIMGNDVVAPDYGLYIADGNFDGPSSGQSKIVNNMIVSNSDYAIYLDDNNDVDVYHNSAYGNPGIRVNDVSNIDLRNNIFASDSDYVFEADDDTLFTMLNYNLYYAAPGNTFFAKFGSNTYPDLAAWQAGYPTFNINSIEGDPLFVAADDLHLIGTLANDVGDNSVGVPLDIDGDTRPEAPSTTVDIGADEYTPNMLDASAISVNVMSGVCGGAAMDILVDFTNLGSTPIVNMPIDIGIAAPGGLISFTYTYTGNLAFGATESGVNVGTFDGTAGGNYSIIVNMQLAGDQNIANDTANTTVFLISAQPPTANAPTICSGQSTTLMPNYEQGVFYGWFDAATGGNLLGIDTFPTPALTSTTTYYLGQIKSIQDSIQGSRAGGSGCSSGNMFDLTNVSTNQFSIDSLALSFNVTGTETVNVYYIAGGTYVGNETTAASWTLLTTETANPVSSADGDVTIVPLSTSLVIPAGMTYAIYVEYNANYTIGAYTWNNGDLLLEAGVGLCSSFGGVNNPRTFNGGLFYGFTDASLPGCTATRTPVTVTINTGPTVSLGVDFSICPGDVAMLDAGNPGYSYLWSTGETTQMITGPAGSYWVDVTDATCMTTSRDSVEIMTNPAVTSTVTATNLNCFGDNSGEIDLVPGGGTAPYAFNWDNGATTEDISGLSAGVYAYTITDSNGCTQNATVSLTEPTVLTSSGMVTDETVAGWNDGTINLTVTGGTAGYSFNWSNGAMTEDIMNLAPGPYSVVVTDANGCTVTSNTYTVNPGIMSSTENLDFINNLQVYPNPTNGLFNLDLELNTPKELAVQVMDKLGRVVLQEASVQITNNTYTFDLSNHSSGIYFIRLQLDNQIVTKRLTLTTN